MDINGIDYIATHSNSDIQNTDFVIASLRAQVCALQSVNKLYAEKIQHLLIELKIEQTKNSKKHIVFHKTSPRKSHKINLERGFGSGDMKKLSSQQSHASSSKSQTSQKSSSKSLKRSQSAKVIKKTVLVPPLSLNAIHTRSSLSVGQTVSPAISPKLTSQLVGQSSSQSKSLSQLPNSLSSSIQESPSLVILKTKDNHLAPDIPAAPTPPPPPSGFSPSSSKIKNPAIVVHKLKPPLVPVKKLYWTVSFLSNSDYQQSIFSKFKLDSKLPTRRIEQCFSSGKSSMIPSKSPSTTPRGSIGSSPNSIFSSSSSSVNSLNDSCPSTPRKLITVLDSKRSRQLGVILSGFKRKKLSQQLILNSIQNWDLKKFSPSEYNFLLQIYPTKTELKNLQSSNIENLSSLDEFLFLLSKIPHCQQRIELYRISHDAPTLLQDLKNHMDSLTQTAQFLLESPFLVKVFKFVLDYGRWVNSGHPRSFARSINVSLLKSLSSYRGIDPCKNDKKINLLHFLCETLGKTSCEEFYSSSTSLRNSAFISLSWQNQQQTLLVSALKKVETFWDSIELDPPTREIVSSLLVPCDQIYDQVLKSRKRRDKVLKEFCTYFGQSESFQKPEEIDEIFLVFSDLRKEIGNVIKV